MQSHFFTRNRQALMKLTSAKVGVLAGHISVQRSNDAAFAFTQEANFWYLTGIEAAGWVLIMTDQKSYLVAPDVDEVHLIFDGSLSFDQAKHVSGVDEVLSYAAGERLLEKLAHTHKTVASIAEDPHGQHYDFAMNLGPIAMYERLETLFESVEDCRSNFASLRAIKQPEEIAALRSAIALTVAGFEMVKRDFSAYRHEYEIEADFTHHFRRSGAAGHAYDPIVAAGKNACTLHYGKNQSELTDGQLVLIDVGAQLQGYPADITRTYVYGSPTDRQRAVHAAVEQAHHEIIALLRPGLDVQQYSTTVDEIMKKALDNLGLLQSAADYRKYFPHAISHGLGIDVHDSLGGPKEFQAGMVLTVEPGIYIPEEGIGVRIEDDILITESGHENLSQQLPTSL